MSSSESTSIAVPPLRVTDWVYFAARSSLGGNANKSGKTVGWGLFLPIASRIACLLLMLLFVFLVPLLKTFLRRLRKIPLFSPSIEAAVHEAIRSKFQCLSRHTSKEIKQTRLGQSSSRKFHRPFLGRIRRPFLCDDLPPFIKLFVNIDFYRTNIRA